MKSRIGKLLFILGTIAFIALMVLTCSGCANFWEGIRQTRPGYDPRTP